MSVLSIWPDLLRGPKNISFRIFSLFTPRHFPQLCEWLLFGNMRPLVLFFTFDSITTQAVKLIIMEKSPAKLRMARVVRRYYEYKIVYSAASSANGRLFYNGLMTLISYLPGRGFSGLLFVGVWVL